MGSSKILVYGGRGALGSAIIRHFKSKNCWVGSIDLANSEEADANVVVAPDVSWCDQEKSVLADVAKVLDGQMLDAVVCVAGGWAGGNAAHEDFVKNADMMWKQSVWSSVIAASIASKHLKEGGLPDESTVVAILPVTLDTPMNRKWMAKADHSTWTSLEFVSELMERWANKEDRPPNGSLVQLLTENSVTRLVYA